MLMGVKKPREVPVPALAPDRLAGILGQQRLSDFRRAAQQVREQIDGSIVWNVNSTAEGGGVAEMLRACCRGLAVRG